MRLNPCLQKSEKNEFHRAIQVKPKELYHHKILLDGLVVCPKMYLHKNPQLPDEWKIRLKALPTNS
jgi:hypothetical protein